MNHSEPHIVERTLRSWIDRHYGPSASSCRFLVALSGGADSVALLASCRRTGLQVVAAHCNFHLRGPESDRDEECARRVCELLGVELYTADFDVRARMERDSVSMEMACRDLRYEWFGRLLVETGSTALLTGHHLDDSVETMWLNLMRGTGLRGAAGIVADGLRRKSPLLSLDRSALLDYVCKLGLPYVVDSSNLACDVNRNKLRNRVLPTLYHDFPNARTGFATSMKNLGESRELLDFAVAQWGEKYFEKKHLRLLVGEIVETFPYPGILVYELLKGYGFNRATTDALLEAYRRPGGEFVSTSGWRAVTDRNGVAVIERADCEGDAQLPQLKIDLLPAEEFQPDKACNTAWFDARILTSEPGDWEVRAWREGDRMQPFGMNGRSKLVSDIYNDAKLGPAHRSRRIVVTHGGRVVWIPGVRQADPYRVAGETAMLVRLSL